MYLRKRTRRKNGKEHRYWSVVESCRLPGGKTAQKHLLYLGELNDVQHAGWVSAIEALDESMPGSTSAQLALFPDDRQELPELTVPIVKIRIDQMSLHNPRQYGACWLTLHLWEKIGLDDFWSSRLPSSREGTNWLNVLKTLVAYRLIDPGSEWRLHRQWLDESAMPDLLDDPVSLNHKDNYYRCLDRLLEHRDEMFKFLRPCWNRLFGEEYDVLLYDLTSTYFECAPPEEPGSSKKRFGYSRDHRSDCVQVVIALVVTPNGFPVAYEVYSGNTNDSSTLRAFLDRIESMYGKRGRTWLMDRGIPTEETLEQMRKEGASYLVGTPKGRLSALEQELLLKPWAETRESVRVKLLTQQDELYVYVESRDRIEKERSMRKRRLRQLWKCLRELRAMKKQTRDQLLMRLGAARKQAGRAWSIVDIKTPDKDEEVSSETFSFKLNYKKLREIRRREGRYLLRSNMTGEDPAKLWEQYLVLTQVEQAFKELKGDLSIRPVYHQKENRIEAHIFVAFIAYCLQATLRQMTRYHAAGLTPRTIIEKFKNIRMLDIKLPTIDGGCITMSRYTEPNRELTLIMDRLKLHLPQQPPPRISYATNSIGRVVPTF